VLDLDAALELVKEFERPAAAIIKHTNPCGCAVADTLTEAYRLADLISFFTAGEDECRAWVVRKGIRAPQAAKLDAAWTPDMDLP